MASPRVLILRAPGTNCDRETAYAFELAGGQVDVVHLYRLLEAPATFREYQVLCIPGGFSYGDDLAAGRIFASQLKQRLSDALQEFCASEKLILGICNGFQVLLQAGLLPGDASADVAATLTWNDSGKFEDRWVRLVLQPAHCPMLAGIDRMYLPIAHAEGKFVVRSSDHLRKLHSARQLVMRYAADEQTTMSDANCQTLPFPDNPNGSQGNVAGICDATGRILGMMPHPERYLQRTQHPRWTRQVLPEAGDGLRVFENAVRYFV